jgi:hypothetical protein
MATPFALYNDAATRTDQDSAKEAETVKKQAAAAAGKGASDHCTVRVGDHSPKQHSSCGRGCSSRTKLVLAALAAVVIIGIALGVGLAVGLPKKGEGTPQGIWGPV